MHFSCSRRITGMLSDISVHHSTSTALLQVFFLAIFLLTHGAHLSSRVSARIFLFARMPKCVDFNTNTNKLEQILQFMKFKTNTNKLMYARFCLRGYPCEDPSSKRPSACHSIRLHFQHLADLFCSHVLQSFLSVGSTLCNALDNIGTITLSLYQAVFVFGCSSLQYSVSRCLRNKEQMVQSWI